MKLTVLILGLMLVCLSYAQNKVAQECVPLLDVGIILDASGSIGESNYNHARVAITNLVDMFDIGPGKVHFGLINFSSISHIDMVQSFLPQGQNKASIKDKIHQMPYYSGITATAHALNYARQHLYSYKRGELTPRIAIVLTDGASSEGIASVTHEAQLLKDEGVEIFAIGIGDYFNQAELDHISSYPDNVLYLSNYLEIADSIHHILEAACTTNAIVSIGHNVDVVLEKFNVIYLATDVTNVKPEYEYVELIVHEYQGRVNIYYSTTEKNPDASNCMNRKPTRTIEQPNGQRLNIYMIFVEKGTKHIFYTIEGLEAKNEMGLRVKVESFLVPK